MNKRQRGKGEKGIAIIMTALVLLPLMVFAAFGVDLASWYSRISYLQKSADAAALAGTVWMPSLPKAKTEATASLKQNGLVDGVDGIVVVMESGSTATSFKVTVTDTDADRVFSSAFTGHDQELTRSAEAEYNLPIPLGSPLNYFGGDASQTNALTHVELWDEIAWPTDYNQVVHAPVNTPCNIGTASAQNFGRWSNATTFDSAGFNSANPRCLFEPRKGAVSGTTTTAPPDYDRVTNLPTNVPCNAFATGTNGRWETATVWNAGTRYTSGTGNRQCVWNNYTTSSSPSTTYRAVASSIDATSRACNLGYQDVNGRWPTGTGAYTTGSRFTGLHTAGNQFCRYYAEINANVSHTIADPNPIPADRNPGLWAVIYGPGQYAANGDAFSARCTSQFNCSSVQNQQYRALTDPNRGYWYVVKIPAGVSGSVDINVFDASYNHDATTKIMDSTEGSGTPDFQTEFRVYKQTNPLDFSVRSPRFGASPSANATDGGCWWQLRKEAAFNRSWSKLCTLTGVQAGDTYLVNVRTNTVGAANEAGNNGYAIEAVLGGNRYADPGPNLYAYGDMSVTNQNVCPSGTCDSTFYLAKVGPQYAGKTLVIEMFDAGDSTGAGSSVVYPMKPSTSAPKPSLNVPASDCEWTATPDPNTIINTTDLRIHTGERRQSASIGPDSGDGSCGVRATVSNVRQFNGEWLRIRVAIPATYNCDATKNRPETEANSCWWGIRYRFSGNASDTTTWQARIEGNPVHLTQ